MRGAAGNGGPYRDPVRTLFKNTGKQTRQVTGTVMGVSPVPHSQGLTVSGYEIHQGRSDSPSGWLKIAGQPIPDGCVDQTGRIWGCYLHGLFANDDFRAAWIRKIRNQCGKELVNQSVIPSSFAQRTQQELDRLANVVEASLDGETLRQLSGLKEGSIP